MNRSIVREHTFKALFCENFYHEMEKEEHMVAYFTSVDETIPKQVEEKIINTCKNILEKIDSIDQIINERTSKWKTTRMNKVDLTILRLAYYEMKYVDDVPIGVAINEAVELAKKYSSDEGPAFINGVLAKLVD